MNAAGNDAERAAFERRALGQAHQPGLSRVISELLIGPLKRGDAAHIDYPPAPLLLHDAESRPGAKGTAALRSVPITLSQCSAVIFCRWAAVEHPGVVYQDVQPPESASLLRRTCSLSVARWSRSAVPFLPGRPLPGWPRCRFQKFGVHIGQHQVTPCLARAIATAFAYSFGRACHQGYFPFQWIPSCASFNSVFSPAIYY